MLNRVIYLVTAQDHPDVLPRTVMLLHRLAVPILRCRSNDLGNRRFYDSSSKPKSSPVKQSASHKT
jgi:hypothetical protein